MFYVYLHTFSNGKCYVGITCNLERRLVKHRYFSKGVNTPHYHAWRKYGEPVRTILHTCETWEQACELEIIEIAERGDYNLTRGGDGRTTKGYSPHGKGQHINLDGREYPSLQSALRSLGRNSCGGTSLRKRLKRDGFAKSIINGYEHYFEVIDENQ